LSEFEILEARQALGLTVEDASHRRNRNQMAGKWKSGLTTSQITVIVSAYKRGGRYE